MHGQISMTDAPRNRHGKKRRTRSTSSRTATGRVRHVAVDPRALVAAQPHRNWLPESLRTSERAISVLGCLNLIWQYAEAQKAGRRSRGEKIPLTSPENMVGITDAQYEAGRRYGVLVAAYRSSIGTPNGVSGNGRGYDCGGLGCDPESCECLGRQNRYQRAYEAVSAIGRQCHLAINRVVIGEELIHARDLEWLRAGLNALVRHFGIHR